MIFTWNQQKTDGTTSQTNQSMKTTNSYYTMLLTLSNIGDFYGQIPDYVNYGMSIRIFTEENIKSGMTEVININFEEIDGEWKIIHMDPYI